MNELSSQSLRPVTARASVVSSKPALAAKGKDKDGTHGKNLPPQAVVVHKPDIQHAASVNKVETAHSAKEKMAEAIARINEYTQSMQRDIRFNLDETSGRTVVTVVDRESKQVIRQIPDEVFLKMARNLKDHINTELKVNSDMSIADSSDDAIHLINTRA